MSTDNDMVFGSSDSSTVEEALQRVKDSFEDEWTYVDGYASSEVAKVLQLDHELGLNQDGDKVILHPVVAMTLPYVARIVGPQELAVIDEKMRSAYDADEESDFELTPAEQEITDRLQYEWIEFRFDLSDPETKKPLPYHPILQDKTISIRVLKEEELGDVEFRCASVRADGTLISVGKTPRTQF